MTNALDPKTPILKGVITEVLDDGNAGKINCGHGNIYTFVSDQLETGYLPVLKDVVEFNLIEDQPFAIRLFHRSQALHSSGSSGASVDLRVKCPHCGKPILPKAEFKEGRLIATHCPECNAELDKIERPPKTTFFTWLIAILAALISAQPLSTKTNRDLPWLLAVLSPISGRFDSFPYRSLRIDSPHIQPYQLISESCGAYTS